MFIPRKINSPIIKMQKSNRTEKDHILGDLPLIDTFLHTVDNNSWRQVDPMYVVDHQENE
jgi:hypothetical protein